ncbi:MULTISPECIES: FAD-dependent oxidoreductase [unclassified Chelatococcus]|uniref:flavin-containing monooxygenase n=1 Tax=unclassified Chelatococcus TaxID=2638111 RepID=UPI001BCE0125|nr:MULTISPECIES: FAD-dependent oxidoreductase [unclassified Chelatococcus]CAH1655278.1 NAD(P)/FAD-dependent oxidoreductase [Hyphomicrobiales bacterium]MBS7742632.1 NAD(P)-binding domain-containing protein [Chelatococcus sp. HY11]MBX3542250.1 NAD(P)-binding domain-containing protein [Chelatococcus sp.]MCO5075534.1 NAD(P)-binding domain-containing protein [Chelatococcus sp.]CAH1695404.1 NAD(P)/FAD-dependent oxidoreductase [Hyphomicrobiales bacterium]
MDFANVTAASDPQSIFIGWLDRFSDYLSQPNDRDISDVFSDGGYWKDLLAFTWQHRVFDGLVEIDGAIRASAQSARPCNLRPASGRPGPIARRRARRSVIEAFFDFDTAYGHGTGFVRLLAGDDGHLPRAWIVLTTLQNLTGVEERIGRNRPSGDEYSRNETEVSWKEARHLARTFEDRDPDVVVIGAGHAGLVAAARLARLDIDTLVIERAPRIGDVWRGRYTSLTLHNELMANHLPYMAFPQTWPVWLTKDQLADWLEFYAAAMELNVWTETTFETGHYDETRRLWTLTLRRADGFQRTIQCRHVVVATGVSGSLPRRGEVPGLADFRGEVLHSAEFQDGADYRGKNAIVVGTGNSGHDIAQDLARKGAAEVSMLQRGPTCVISLKPGASMIYNIYNEDHSIEDIDLIAASIPYPQLKDIYRGITRKAAEMDAEMLAGLAKAGFKTYFGGDDAGFQMMYMRGEGGYYIDVGCSEMIARGEIRVLQASDSAGFEADGLRLRDGTLVACDLVVLATGFHNMQENIRLLFGDETADKIGPVWGFDDHFQMRNMWRRTAQNGLWLTGGALLDSRIFSRFLALEIKADLLGILPERSALPLAGWDQ